MPVSKSLMVLTLGFSHHPEGCLATTMNDGLRMHFSTHNGEGGGTDQPTSHGLGMAV